MTFEKFVFYVFALITVYAAFRVITVRNPVHAVLHLVLAFFSSAGIWLLAEAEFLGITLVLVYVGAVMVLFLFVVMMLDVNLAPLREGFVRYLPVGGAIGGLMILEMSLILASRHFAAAKALPPHGPHYSNTRELGALLYTDYAYPFEIAAFILLVAIVAAIALTLRRRPDARRQQVGEQVRVRRQDRVRLVAMAAESRSAGPAEEEGS